MQTVFEGIWVPIVTPFRNDTIDHATLSRLARHLASAGISGIVVSATTGEGALLDPAEQAAIMATLREAVPSLPLVPGIAEADTRRAVARARSLAALEPAGLLVTTPLYVRPSQDGIRAHFEAVSAADVPILIYDIPYRTGVTLAFETLQRLARDERIAGIKACGASPDAMQRMVHETRLRVLCGDDASNFAALCAGAHGTIAASAHIRTDLHVRMWNLLRENRLSEARRIAVALQPLIQALFSAPNPAPLKALLAHQGFGDGSLRLPFLAPECEVLERLLRAHEGIDLH